MKLKQRLRLWFQYGEWPWKAESTHHASRWAVPVGCEHQMSHPSGSCLLFYTSWARFPLHLDQCHVNWLSESWSWHGEHPMALAQEHRRWSPAPRRPVPPPPWGLLPAAIPGPGSPQDGSNACPATSSPVQARPWHRGWCPTGGGCVLINHQPLVENKNGDNGYSPVSLSLPLP